MFRRKRRLNAAGLPPSMLQQLIQANQLIASGQTQPAAPLFTAIAANLLATNHPRRAANCYAQAAHAYADSHQPDQAVIQAKNALNLFIQYQMVERTPRFFVNITHKLRQHGMIEAAASLESDFRQQALSLTKPTLDPEEGNRNHRSRLPPACPKCGAPILSPDAAWIDDTSAECDYCGAVVLTVRE